MKNKINEKQDYKAVVALAVSSAQPPFFTFRLVGGGLLLLEGDGNFCKFKIIIITIGF